LLEMIPAILVVNNHETGFSEEHIESEVFYSLLWIAAREDREIRIVHDGGIPHIRNGYRLVRRNTDDLGVYSSAIIRLLQDRHGLAGKTSLWKNHDPVVGNRRPRSQPVHPVQGLVCLPGQNFCANGAEFSPCVVASVNGK